VSCVGQGASLKPETEEAIMKNAYRTDVAAAAIPFLVSVFGLPQNHMVMVDHDDWSWVIRPRV